MLSGSSIDTVHESLIRSIRMFFGQTGMTKAVLGLSGGIDSAVVAALAAQALGKDNVTGILMPSSYSTVHSVNDAVELADNLGIRYHIIPIGSIYDKFMKETEPLFEGDFHWDTTQENLQARIRGTILMVYSNRHGALLLNTTNKSELSMGYGTLYGDLCGSLMVIADLYKTEVYELAAHINMTREIIPASTITKAPSAELRDGQKDTDSLPPYDVLDPVLYSLNEKGMTEEQILQEGTDRELVERVLRLRRASAFKAHQLPPEIKISSKPLLDAGKWVEAKD
ncbi:MAG TPA: NAD(+) synthase [Candidatus Coprenecus stercoravium]|uniref:NH(3)-dependent NAD(+) synthetase n=1 Tax=Candidatus Coprenecus stercoravium TaxID=2840735 RepID=A0A9D2KAM0_9BACT|nr:NAD(+) synthase [Candidatus Coprenecus stercoravium]